MQHGEGHISYYNKIKSCFKWILFNFFYALIIHILFINSVNAQDGVIERERSLYFTYIGPVASAGINQIKYKDWFTDKREEKDISGNYYSGGILLDIFVRNLIGEFSIEYIYNSNKGDTDVSVQHLIYLTSGKYSFNITEDFAIAPGIGMYMETPPSDRKYDGGGGFTASLGIFYNIGIDYKIILDITGRYGTFGMGEESTKLSYGTKIGVVYSIGRI